ncbi:MAG: putative Ig domain-containing protein, partial [Nitrosomonas sp.]|nr:putative Ig domain-containing protein [Nitrosomonas sp.]
VDTIKITLDSASLTESLSVSSLPTGYTTSYDSNTGLLTISSGTGGITDANWESVLRSIQYSNSSNNPPEARIITVVASDTVGAETSDSNAALDTITITAINDAPVIIAALVDQAVQYDTVGWSYDASASFSDADIADSLSYSATLANDDPLPTWIQIDDTTGLITESPGFGDRGTYALKVTATDTHGLSADGTLTVAVTAFDAGRLLVSTNGSDTLVHHPTIPSPMLMRLLQSQFPWRLLLRKIPEVRD